MDPSATSAASPPPLPAAEPGAVLLYVDFPPPVLPADVPVCVLCKGLGVTGNRHVVDLHDKPLDGSVRRLLVDEFCLDCRGCGQAVHLTCVMSEHFHAPAIPFGGPDDDDPNGPRCEGCGGRGWIPADGLHGDPSAEERATGMVLRLPCPCQMHRARQIEDPFDPGPVPPYLDGDVLRVLGEAYDRWKAETSLPLMPVDRREGWVAMSALQLAWRHPDVDEGLKKTIRKFGRLLQGLICDTPDVLALAETGWHRQFDIDLQLPAELQEVATCVSCGCTEDQPCEGGCSWMTDPLGMTGELCSRCALPGRHEAAVTLGRLAEHVVNCELDADACLLCEAFRALNLFVPGNPLPTDPTPGTHP